MHPFVSETARIIAREGLLPDGCRAVVAVSGGCDSMTLLHVLATLAARHRWHLVPAHFNHHLRGMEADADKALVEAAAAARGLSAALGGARVAKERRSGESIEAAGRRLRHAFLAGTARAHDCDRIVTAHQADDQIELFLLRLLRGAGVRGLGGMRMEDRSPADLGIRLVRPFLGWAHDEIRVAAIDLAVEWREDLSNLDRRFLRNRVRHELLPLLENGYQPAIRRVLARAQTLWRDQAEWAERSAREWLGGRNGQFDSLPVALQREVLRVQLSAALIPPSFELIEALRGQPGTPIQVDIARMVRRETEGRVCVEAVDDSDPIFRRDEIRLDLSAGSGRIAFAGLRIDWEVIEQAGEDRGQGPGQNEEVFDADAMGTVVTLRHWRPGDRFRPIGLRGRSKLQDLFTNRRLPAEARHRAVVAETADGTIFWVEGLRMGECAKLTAGTQRRVLWRWTRGEPLQLPSHGRGPG
jgi:tRNA(Ile)-lysidine synthase